MTSLSIGTAQFGLNYGITNKGGIVEQSEVRSIVREAAMSGVKSVDTAHAYGCAQERLGMMDADIQDFKITTKVGVGIDESQMSTKQIRSLLAKQLEISLRDLKRTQVDTLLLHTTRCLSKSHRTGILEFLDEAKEQGFTKKVGASVYSQLELDEGYISSFDVVQLPLSIFNQRMLQDGTIGHLKRLGIDIQARGVFHQGLLLCSAEFWPEWINANWKQRQHSIEAYVKGMGASLASAALGFIKSVTELDTVVVGVCSQQELKDIIEAWNNPLDLPGSLIVFSSATDDVFCDPRKWPKLQSNE